VAVASRDAARADAYAREHGFERGHGSYESLLADPDVEAVYISLPNALHHHWTLAALTAGKHVLCEKPYSRTPAEVDEAFDAADAAGRILMEAFMWRHHPQTRRMLELLPDVGEVQAVRSTFMFRLSRASDIRLSADLIGGSLMDVGCYCVSASRLVAGAEPERVSGEALMGPSGVDVRFTGMLRFPNGVVSGIASGFGADHRGLEVIGSQGTLVVADPWQPTEGRIVVDGREERTPAADPYQCEIEDMSEAIRGLHPPRLGRADALGQARTIDALVRAAAEGRSVGVGTTA
jgi:xylose dehydrogenase (NAD/NADP)